MDIGTMRAVLNTLEKISVSGKDNLGYVLGLIRLFEEEIIRAAEEGTTPREDDEDGER